MSEIRIPDIGDAENVEVIEICVGPGDAVGENDALIVIESDKASMEVPAPGAGTISEVLVALGDRVNAGDAIARFAASGAAAQDAAPQDASPEPKPQETAEEPPAPEPQPEPPASPATAAPPATTAPSQDDAARAVYAGPAVRRLARELGVDLAAVSGSGAQGRIVKDDVKAFVKQSFAAGPAGPGPLSAAPAPQIDFSRFGAVETVLLTRIRARGAANLQRSWQQVAHVTQHDEADVTELEAFRKSLAQEAAARDAKLTPLPFIVRAAVHALKRHASFNASLNADLTALIVKRYYHIGIAVDTADGLVVPVLRNADALGIFEIAGEIARLSAAAHAGRLKPDEIQGASFTISSLGAIGGTGFTPIVNAPEVAILGVARMDTRPVWNGEAFAPRRLMPLSLSYDHRAINGAEAGRFVQELRRTLGDVRRLIL